jgi:hypothetical protein
MSQHSRTASSTGRGDVSMLDVGPTTDDHPENDIGRWLNEIVAPSLDHSAGLSAKKLLDGARRDLNFRNIELQKQCFYEEDWLAFQSRMMELLEELDVKQLIRDTGSPPTWMKAIISMDHITGAIQAVNAEYSVKMVLKRPKAERPQTMTDLAISLRQEDKHPRRQAVLKDFKKEYIGTAVDSLHQLLRHAIQKNQTQKKYYAPVMAIVQSSGTGKSRTAVELTKHVLGLYVCVRPPGSGNINSAPPQDISVYRYLKPEYYETPEESALAVAFWLKAYCVEFRRYCLAKREKAGTQLSHKEFVRLVSSSLMEGLLPDVDRGIRDGTSFERTRLLDAISSKATEFAEAFRNTDPASPPVIFETLLVNMVKPDFRLLEEIVGQDDFIFLAFDEAISLGPQRLTALRRLLNHLKLKKFWVLVLDTNNRVSEIAVRAAVEPSLRLLNRDLYLAPLFVALPHDLFLSTEQGATRYNKILSGEISVTHRELIALLPKMGRPLWDDSSLKNEDMEQFAIAGVSMRAIYEKLIGGSMDIAQKEMTDARTIATICQRVPLQLIGVQGKLRAREVTGFVHIIFT